MELVSAASRNPPAWECVVGFIGPDCSRRGFPQSSILRLRYAPVESVNGDLYLRGIESQGKSLDMFETE